jgi:hypothetical protein
MSLFKRVADQIVIMTVGAGRGRLVFLRFAKLLFFAFEQFVEFVNELQKSTMVFFFLDQSAQLIQAFSFRWIHRDMG